MKLEKLSELIIELIGVNVKTDNCISRDKDNRSMSIIGIKNKQVRINCNSKIVSNKISEKEKTLYSINNKKNITV